MHRSLKMGLIIIRAFYYQRVSQPLCMMAKPSTLYKRGKILTSAKEMRLLYCGEDSVLISRNGLSPKGKDLQRELF